MISVVRRICRTSPLMSTPFIRTMTVRAHPVRRHAWLTAVLLSACPPFGPSLLADAGTSASDAAAPPDTAQSPDAGQTLDATSSPDSSQLPDAMKSVDAAQSLDARSPDAAPDAAPAGPVSIQIVVGGVAQSGLDVFFESPGSSAADLQVTDNNGVASSTVAAGGSVIAEPAMDSASPTIFAVEGVKPGDALTFITPGTVSRTIQTTFPAEPNAFGYSVAASCGNRASMPALNSTPPTSAPADVSRCGATADLLLTALDSHGVTLGSMFASNVSTAQDYTFAGTYTTPRTISAQLTDIPVGLASNMSVGISIFNDNGAFLTNQAITLDAATLSGTLVVPDVPGVRWTMLTDVRSSGGGASEEAIFETIAPTDSYSLDVGSAILPLPSNFAIDPTTNLLTWDQAEPADIDFVAALVGVQRSLTEQIIMVIEAPYDATGVAMPVLPNDAAIPLLEATDTVQIGVAYYAKASGGYDSVRSNLTGSLQFKDAQKLQVGQRITYAGILGH